MIVFGNHVLCLAVLFLLQSAGWMGMVQGEPLISVRITNHIYLRVGENSAPHVTYDFSKEICEERGAYVLSGYTKAIRTEVMNKAYSFGHGEDIIFYIGADAEYSVHKEPDPSKKCLYSVPSLNCIYKWNQGIWANALGDESGVGFYKGNDPFVRGAGVINGYDVTVAFSDRIKDKSSIIRDYHEDDNFIFSVVVLHEKPGITLSNSMAVCEMQDGIITTTTKESQSAGSGVSSAPEKLDDDSRWWKRLTLIMGIILIFFVILAIVLCLYFCEYICRRKADGRRVPENSGLTIHADREGSVMHRRENSNTDTDVGSRTNPLLGEDGQDGREKMRNTWIETSHQVNVVLQADSAVPSDSDSSVEQQSRRVRSMDMARSRRRMPIKITEVEVPIAAKVVVDAVDEGHESTHRTMTCDAGDVV